MTTAYNHPHFVAETADSYEFKPFTGTEPRPEPPAEFYQDRSLSRETCMAISNQYAAADKLWSKAKYRATVKPLIKPALAAWKKYKTAKAEMDDIYAGFWAEKDGGWQARIMRLLDARTAALDAADEYENDHARGLAVASDEHQNVMDRYMEWSWLRLSDVAQEMNVDIGDMNPGSASAEDWRECGPALVDELNKTIREQDRKLRQVKELAG